MKTFREVLSGIAGESNRAWVYLPIESSWTLDSNSAVLESEEVPPELEDEPDAGVPEVAKQNSLAQTLPVTVVQDIATNALAQKPDASLEDLFSAFEFYFKNDAFIEFK